MTRVEAVKLYKEQSVDFIKDCKARKDLVMLREDWLYFVDGFNRNGEITNAQADRWSNPF